MPQRIAHIALVVRDYDEAIEFYVGKLGFQLFDDTWIAAEEKRWVGVAPKGARECSLLLAKASTAEQEKAIGNQTGGRVFLFLFTDDFFREYERMKAIGIQFVRPPREEEYGTVAVFADLYGNLWDLLQPTEANSACDLVARRDGYVHPLRNRFSCGE